MNEQVILAVVSAIIGALGSGTVLKVADRVLTRGDRRKAEHQLEERQEWDDASSIRGELRVQIDRQNIEIARISAALTSCRTESEECRRVNRDLTLRCERLEEQVAKLET